MASERISETRMKEAASLAPSLSLLNMACPLPVAVMTICDGYRRISAYLGLGINQFFEPVFVARLPAC